VGLRYANRPLSKPYRVSVIVAKKVHKSAVKRNRIRRRIYEIVRKSDYAPESTDLILTVFNEQVAYMPAEELEEQVNNLLQKISK
jgi:ribonuclease P protein component